MPGAGDNSQPTTDNILSMKLYVLRHAEAVDHAPTDAARELTPHGLEQARRVGEFCRQHDLAPELVLTSPYRRAVQTAELFAAALGQTPQEAPFLASGMHPATALRELTAYTRLGAVVLVGHQPDLGQLITTLIGLPREENFPVGKASLTCLDVERLLPGGASLRFTLPARLMA